MKHTIEQLRAELTYVPQDGSFIRNRTGKKSAGTINDNGYRCLRVDGHTYNAHRLAWFIHHGEVPDCLDHINQDKSDNRIKNLRVATRSQNRANTPKRSNNKSGYKGVRASGNKFCATIKYQGKAYHLGTYDDAFTANTAYRGAAIILYGEFACH